MNECLIRKNATEDILPRNINLDKPRYDQNYYMNRARYFFATTNPLNIFTSSRELERSRCLIIKYKRGENLPPSVKVDDLWRAKNLYDSAYHPDTGEKMNIMGRMSAQVPMNMLITGGMLTFYRSTSAIIFWQWLNQSFNALVNYTNRSGKSKISNTTLATSYVLATGGALATALTLNRMVRCSTPLLRRLVPFAAVAAANCINIPMMRMYELKNGVEIHDECGHPLGRSTAAARSGIAQVVFSRILMSMPGMVLVPFIINRMECRGDFCRYPWAVAPVQIALVGLCLTFATPLCCALFKQMASIRVSHLEKQAQENIRLLSRPGCDPSLVYYNKGL